ncbi:LPS export ABC transporter permease LptF [Vibrio anguillarum]|uniref:Lipopolysaccharide export system permease protein LptF n=6 Tax=Vibrio TaxID=662 RepID=A0A191W6A2_VIBAN|nr:MULTISPECIES: LPS export ABC transporter permease LptF [Vibrio]MCS0351002.1 LPS export ABC transporter permease LptF [Vibrio ordalii]NAW90027.1 LPS export ABC transporter permease LptF [Vibrio sp. V24_P1S3T111]NAX16737.1 LPS export ABC transporter permease LptF [Vibrio sp. V22_P2S10T140]NAX42933.1 LPS export ABC transporter permease LptF [Vibrio sp. V25_P4S6T154]NNN48373.1 LPS export ABC transporter permease LptF [Vibrio sp. 2-2(8)]NNN69345.1 LPS export ABC transporter permease LptF [Vibri
MIIVRYLIRETLKSQFAIFFVLFLVFLSQRFIRVLAEASDGDIPARMILSIVSLNMPAMGLLMLPLSLYIGILLTFGRLYAESEITVMNATGIGNKFLIRAALYLALITSGAAAFNAFWLAPWSQDKEAQLMEQLAAENSVDLLQKGQFQRTPDGSSVVFIENIENKKLHNVFVAQLAPKDSILPSVMFSNSGDVKELSDGRQMITMYDGIRYEGVPTRVDYMITKFDEYEGLIGQREVKPKGRDWEALPTSNLLSNPDRRAKAELQWRISLVICIPLLTMLVVPLSAVNPRQGRFAKMGPAILIYLAYFMAISATKSAIEDGSLATVIGMWPINAALLLAAISVNIMDSVPVRRFKDKLRLKKAA